MITDAEALYQIERVMDLPFSPRTDAGKAELIRALLDTARSQQHARATMDTLVRGERCPTPKEIIDTAWSLLTDEERRGNTCKLCGGSGWRYTPIVKAGIKYDASSRCVCNSGSAPAEKPRESKMASAGEIEVTW